MKTSPSLIIAKDVVIATILKKWLSFTANFIHKNFGTVTYESVNLGYLYISKGAKDKETMYL